MSVGRTAGGGGGGGPATTYWLPQWLVVVVVVVVAVAGAGRRRHEKSIEIFPLLIESQYLRRRLPGLRMHNTSRLVDK